MISKKEYKMIYVFIFILTLFDCLLTLWGISSGKITEGNPLLVKLFSWDPFWGVTLIVIAVGLILVFISKQKIKWLQPVVMGLLWIKILVMFLHIRWMA